MHTPAQTVESRYGVWPLVAAWVVAIAAIGAWLAGTSAAALREQLTYWQFWSLEAQFYLLLALTLAVFPAAVRAIGLRPGDLFLPAAAAALTLVLALGLAPRANRIFYDEQIYQSIGQNLSDLRRAQMCNDGNVEYGALQCWRGEYNKEPYAYPYLLSLAYRVTGVRESTPFILNPVLAALTVAVVFFITVALTGSRTAGGAASIVAALVPEHLRWAHTAAAEPSAAFACSLAVLAALAFVRLRSTLSLYWMMAATVFASQFRPECALIVAVVGVIVLIDAPDELRRERFWWAALAAVVMGAVHLGHLAAIRGEGWGTTGPRISTIYLPGNLRVNGAFLLGDHRFPVVYTALAATALVLWRRPARLAVLLTYFVLFWGIFVVFYAGSYNYGADDRFSLMISVPVAVLAGIGAWRLVDQMASRGIGRRTARLAMTGMLAAQFLWYTPFVRAVGEEAWAARADVAFARDAVSGLPRNAIVLTHNPNMFHVWGQSAAQASIAASDLTYATGVLAPRYRGGVFFHWSFWCNVADPVQQAFCARILDEYPHEMVREHRERDYRYAIYRLTMEPPAADARVP